MRNVELCVALALSLAAGAAAQTPRDVELAIAKARYNVPPASDASVADLAARIREQAKKSEVAVEIVPGPTTRLTPLLELRALDVSGRDHLEEVQIFLMFVSNLRYDRLIDYESLHLVAQPGGRVGFRVRVAMACWVEGPLTDAPATLEAMRTLDARYQPVRAVNAIGDLERELHEHAVALTELSFGADTRVSGVVLGTGAREALVPALESSAFRVGHVDFAARGDCQAFTAPMELLAAANVPDKPSWAKRNVFDADTASHCAPPRATPPRRIAAQGGGSVTMHLRNVDAADVFRALNAATKEGFIVTGSVGGRFDVDFDHATRDAALAALKEAGIAPPLTLPAGDYRGETISMTLRDADLADVLLALGTVSNHTFPAPPPGTRISVFATDEPWDRLAAALQLVKPAPQEPQQSEDREWWRVDRIERWSARDLTFAGVVASAEKGWIAYAYTPGAAHKIFELTPSTKLRDARVKSIDAGGVTLDNAFQLLLPAGGEKVPRSGG